MADRDGIPNVEVVVAVAVCQAQCSLVGTVARSGKIGGVIGVDVESHEEKIGFVSRGFASRSEDAVVAGAEGKTDVTLPELGMCSEADCHQNDEG